MIFPFSIGKARVNLAFYVISFSLILISYLSVKLISFLSLIK
ncbi:hypothetical protein ALT721_600025 [Alteromonas alvinellae]